MRQTGCEMGQCSPSKGRATTAAHPSARRRAVAAETCLSGSGETVPLSTAMGSLSEHLTLTVLLHAASTCQPGCPTLGSDCSHCVPHLHIARRLNGARVCIAWRTHLEEVAVSILYKSFSTEDVGTLLNEAPSDMPTPNLWNSGTLTRRELPPLWNSGGYGSRYRNEPIFEPCPVVTNSGVVAFNAANSCWFKDSAQILKILWTLKSVVAGLEDIGHIETADRCSYHSLHAFIAPLDADIELCDHKQWFQPAEEGNPLGINPELSPCAGGSEPRWIRDAEDCPFYRRTTLGHDKEGWEEQQQKLYAEFDKLKMMSGSDLLRIEFGRDSIVEFPLFYICKASSNLICGVYTKLYLS